MDSLLFTLKEGPSSFLISLEEGSFDTTTKNLAHPGLKSSHAYPKSHPSSLSKGLLGKTTESLMKSTYDLILKAKPMEDIAIELGLAFNKPFMTLVGRKSHLSIVEQ